jgi:hypothetical protein
MVPNDCGYTPTHGMETIYLSSYLTDCSTMSQNPLETTSDSTYDLVFENALKAYKKKTGKDLASDPLLRRLETCNSPDGVLSALREQVPDSDQSGTHNDRLVNWLDPTVNVLLNFSDNDWWCC